MKIKSAYLILVPLLLSSCFFKKNTSTSSSSKISSSSISSSSSGQQDKYRTETINVYYINDIYNTKVDIRFYDGGSIPYISIKEFVKLLYRGRTYPAGRDSFEISKNGSKYDIVVAGGYTATFNVDDNTFSSPDIWAFKNTNLNGIGDLVNVSYDGLPFTKVISVDHDAEPTLFFINFNDYDIEIFGDGDAVYVPITFATDLYSNENILAGAYNRKDLFFFNYTENEFYSSFGSLFFEPMFSKAIEEDYAKYAYNELCLDYDNFLGRPGRSTLEQYYDLTKGLDAALEERPLGRVIKQYLSSTNLSEYIAGTRLLDVLRQDGGHSNCSFLNTVGYSGGASWYTSKVQQESNNLFNEQYNKAYSELVNSDRIFSHHQNVYKARNEKLGLKYGSVNGTDTYQKDEDIAYIHIDGFMGEIELQDEWNDYYSGKSDTVPFGKNQGGAVGAIQYGLNEAYKDSDIKHIVVDLSANTGGSTDEMLFMIYMLTGSTKFYTKNTITNVYQTTEYAFDTNFDRVFDENDDCSYLLEGKDVSVLTTRNGFSCGGISPVYLHDEGCFTIGENCGGGSCSIYIQFDAYGNFNAGSTPSHTVNKYNVSIDQARFSVCDYKLDFGYSSNQYDYSSLFDTTSLRKIIEEHYA